MNKIIEVVTCTNCKGEKFVGRDFKDCPTCKAYGVVPSNGEPVSWSLFRLAERNEGYTFNNLDAKPEAASMTVEENTVIEEFIADVIKGDMEYFKSLKELRNTITYKEWMDKRNEGEITKADSDMIRHTDEDILRIVTKDAMKRKEKMKQQINKKVGDIISMDIERNVNNGFDGTVTGTNGTFTITTILAGGFVQRLHHRTLIKKA